MTMRQNHQSVAKLLVGILVLIMVSGCASFKGGQLEQITSWPPPATNKKKTISIVTKGSMRLNEGEAKVAQPAALDIWTSQATKAYTDSGLFSQVNRGEMSTDLRAEIEIIDNGKGNIAMAVLTGLTLYVIPSTATDEFTMKTTIKDRRGRVLGSFVKKESVTLWQQVLLIFAMPFKFPVTVVNETLYDLNRATINEAHAKGII